MRLAALFSGGKDSTFAAHIAEASGHEVAVLFSMQPRRGDSWMFHSVNIHLTRLLAEAWGKPIVEVPTQGEKEKELEDLQRALAVIPVEGVVTGAIASAYQRDRVDRICRTLGIRHVAPLWGVDQGEVLREEVASGMEIIFSAVAAEGLGKDWLGRRLDAEAVAELEALHDRFGLNVCGEGGEYESLVLDAPWLLKRLVVRRADPVWDGTSGEYRVREAVLQSKAGDG